VKNVLQFPEVALTAICHVDPAAIAQTHALLPKADRKEAAAYGKGERDYKNMLKRNDLDGMIIATPWEWHVPMAVATMTAGEYAGLEVSATVKLEELWQLVDTYENTGATACCSKTCATGAT
jgi:predicted dehydrogenase